MISFDPDYFFGGGDPMDPLICPDMRQTHLVALVIDIVEHQWRLCLRFGQNNQ